MEIVIPPFELTRVQAELKPRPKRTACRPEKARILDELCATTGWHRKHAVRRTLDPVAPLAEIRRCQEELGSRIDARGIKVARRRPVQETLPVPTGVGDFARTLGTKVPDTIDVAAIEPRATHRRPKRRYKTRMRMPSLLDPHLTTIASWLAAEPNITALTIVRRLTGIDPTTFGDKQHSIGSGCCGRSGGKRSRQRLQP